METKVVGSMEKVDAPKSTNNKLLNSPVEGNNIFIQQQKQLQQSDIVSVIETLDETDDDVTLNSKIKFDNLISPTSATTNGFNFKPTSVLLLYPEHQKHETDKISKLTKKGQQQSRVNSFLLHEDEDSKDATLNDHSTTRHLQIDRETDNNSSTTTETRFASLRSRRSFNSDFARTSSIRDDQDASTSSDDLTIDCSDFNSSDGSRVSLSIEEAKHITIREARDIYNLQCQLCKENYRNPRVLPCLHSFCHSCLEDKIR